jgi:hypothetical protein
MTFTVIAAIMAVVAVVAAWELTKEALRPGEPAIE